jgi:hypothetical protein
MQVVQTGAWISEVNRPLPDPLERFLEAGEPPIDFGFGSMRARTQTSRALIEAARALGRRARRDAASSRPAHLRSVLLGEPSTAVGSRSFSGQGGATIGRQSRYRAARLLEIRRPSAGEDIGKPC